ncbi:MAG TPA: hypothetical protein VFQ50_07205 [Flavobacterium sp.]|nr:hypothetical protein [Flavobacterium sp.]
MELNLKNGIDKLLFGMRQKDVIAIYGVPQKKIIDEDQNILYIYNQQKWQLTFYEDEDFRLGYIVCANPELTLFSNKIIGVPTDEVKAMLQPKGLKTWELEEFDLVENYFNEDFWLVLQSEFGYVAKIDIGAIIKDDEFEWKF